MSEYCYLNEKILPVNKASVALNDIALLRAYAIFDYLRTYNGKPFLINEHLTRFQRSAKGLNLKLPISANKIKEIITVLLKKNKFKESGIRLVLTGGYTQDSMTITNPNFFILIEKLNELPESIFINGAKLLTYEHQRELAQIKTINYLTSINLKQKQERANAIEVLYYSKGKVLECSRSNIFIFKKNVLITPKDNILFGIRRNYILKLAKPYYEIKEINFSLKELFNADEAFITSTGRSIVPIVKIDNTLIGKGKPGNKTKLLMELYNKQVKSF